jgi:prepilin peptidase CpaA
MTSQTFQLALIAGLALALAFAAITDWRSRIIDNWLNLGIALTAPLYWWATGLSMWPGVAMQIGFAFIVTLIFTGAFALRAMGGGDVKLLGALALWFSPLAFVSLAIIMSILGGVLTIIMLMHHKITKSLGKPEIPYGVAISMAGLWSIYERYLNHFG